MSVFVLKLIAMVTMVVDHVADGFCGNPMWMRTIGRFAFPVYAFLLAEGFRHIRSSDKRISSHLSKLVLLALVSELGYDMLDFGLDFGRYATSQNNIITLLLAFLGLWATEKWKERPLYVAATYGLTSFINYTCCSNYRFAGVLLVYAFYWYLNTVMPQDGSSATGYGKRFGLLLGVMAIYVPIYHLARNHFALDETMIQNFITYLPWYVMHIAIAAALALYNGKLGYKKPWFNLFYSWFYPVHLLLLGLLKLAIM